MSAAVKQSNRRFDRFASLMARWTGHGLAFASAAIVTLAWALSGPVFHFSNGWQLVINTSTTVLTFLMVFIIQNTLNRDSSAVHLKLDELLRVTSQARDALIGVERLGQRELETMHEHQRAIASGDDLA